MSGLAWLLAGLLLGGCIAATVLCCVQAGRASEYEQEIRRLKEKRNDKI